MSLKKRLVWSGVGVALGCLAAFSAVKYADSHYFYQLSGGPQLARATAALNESLTSFSSVYTQLTGSTLKDAYVDISEARKNIENASYSLDTAVKEAEDGIGVRVLNGFDNTIAEHGLNIIRSSRETVSSILASLPSGSTYHGGREQSLLVEANSAANEALQILRETPLGSNYKALRISAIGVGIAGLFALLIGTVFYKGLARWFTEEEAKKRV